MKFTKDGQEIISFAQYLQEMAGSGVIYERENEITLRKYHSADWIHVDEYIAPLVHHILVDAAETNREVFENLMTAVIEAYDKLKPEIGLIPPLNRIK